MIFASVTLIATLTGSYYINNEKTADNLPSASPTNQPSNSPSPTANASPASLMINAEQLTSNATVSYGGQQSIIANCRNDGNANGTFNVIATCTNASFLASTNQTYQLINSTTVKIPFTLNAAEKQSTNIPFAIDNDTEKFIVSLQLESNQTNLFVEPQHLPEGWHRRLLRRCG